MKREPPVWLFDGMCLLCSRAVQYTLTNERGPAIRFVAIQSAEGRALAKRHGIDPDDPDSFLFVENGFAQSKSDGVMAWAAHVNGLARLLLLGRIMPKAMRDWLYDRIARNRYRLFGMREQCIVPEPSQRARFVLPESLP